MNNHVMQKDRISFRYVCEKLYDNAVDRNW